MKSKIFLSIVFLLSLTASVFAQPKVENFGYVPNPEATKQFVSSLPPLYGEQVKELIATDNNADALLYRALTPSLENCGRSDWLKARGSWKVVRSYNQGSVGSCVGNACACVLSTLNGVQVVVLMLPQEFTAMHNADAMYGLNREAAGMLGRSGDGCYGSAAAKSIQNLGTLYQLQYGSVDLRQNQPSRAKQYGTRGVGDALKAEAAKHKCASATQVKSAQEAWSLIGNGYPINVCSNQGFSKQRDSEGICRPSGNWAHAMSVVGRRTTSGGKKLFLIWNSWGDNWASGPYWEDMPEGSFWVEWNIMDSMLSRGDSFAYGGLEGFKRQGLENLGTKEYLGLLKIGEKIHVEQICFGVLAGDGGDCMRPACRGNVPGEKTIAPGAADCAIFRSTSAASATRLFRPFGGSGIEPRFPAVAGGHQLQHNKQ